MNRERFINTLARLVGYGARLQNAPNAGLVPEEVLACAVVEEVLLPLQRDGFLTLKRYNAPGQESRPSLVITVPGVDSSPIGFVGAHFDVVPADQVAENWVTDPFQLAVEAGGILRGRGVTDCLGHVALLTELLLVLHARGVRPRRTLHIVMIANEEERSVPGIGLEYVAEVGALEPLKAGPLFWLDSADFGPTLGTGGIVTWRLVANGVSGHSGMPHNCVNALELATAALHSLHGWFAREVPPHTDETRWRFSGPSSCKATMMTCDNNKITKIPAEAVIYGDMRITPFYDVASILAGAIRFIDSLDQKIKAGEQPAGFPRVHTQSGESGSIRLIHEGKLSEGIACDLESVGLRALNRALAEVRGRDGVQPYSMTGSLPLVRDLQRRGFDVQITGFGESRSYHAPNEQGTLKDFEDGFAVLEKIIEYVDT